MLDHAFFVSFTSGLTLSASLIVAIGAQNAYVLRQGLRREQVAVVVLVCGVLDMALMSAGVGGLGVVVNTHPRLVDAVAVGGALALAWYGLAAFRRALGAHALRAELSGARQTAGRVFVQTLGLSLLNPHVYLDTVVLVGTVGARQPAGTQGAFLAGACLASAVWFASLGFGARLLSPLFARATAWRVLDVLVGLTMCGMAFKLVAGR